MDSSIKALPVLRQPVSFHRPLHKNVEELANFYLGRAGQATYWDRIWSTLVVADFIYREMVAPILVKETDKTQFLVQEKNIFHPLSVVMKQDLMLFTFANSVRTQLKACYLQLQAALGARGGVILDEYGTFTKKLRQR